MKKKYVQITYLLSLSLILFGIIYFFASNWDYLDRIPKVILSVSLMFLFYVSSFFVRHFLKRHYFLSHWLLFAGSIAFGVSILLIGQVYNWHADSYWLYLVWLIPMLLFSFITKYQPFYFASYVLFNLAFWFYMNPSSVNINRTDEQDSLLFLLLAIVNLAIFIVTTLFKTNMISVKASSLIMFNFVMLILSFGVFEIAISFLYLFVLGGITYFYHKHKNDKVSFGISLTFATLFVFSKVFVWIIEGFGELILLLALAGVVGLIIGGIHLVKFINKKSDSTNKKWFKHITNWLNGSIIFIVSTIGSLALVGLIALASGFNEYVLFILGLGLSFGGLFIEEDLPTVKYSFISSGYLIASLTALLESDFLNSVLIVSLIIMLFILTNKVMNSLTYGLLNLLVILELQNFIDSMDVAFTMMIVLNLIVFLFSKFDELVKYLALVLSYALLLILTFNDYNTFAYITYNIIFFASSTFMIYWSKKQERSIEYYLSFIFWFVFVSIKYYDFAWELFHQSILLITIGIILWLVANRLDKDFHEEGSSFLDTNRKYLFALIAIQVISISFVCVYHENILKNGTEIKLELEPLDPRSLFQGDYVILSYAISNIEIDDLNNGTKIDVLLRKDFDGVYKYAGNYKYNGGWKHPYVSQEGDVIINGTYNGYDSVYYGIESYFVPEGTGLEVEESANYALVRVGENQNALLVDLLQQ